MAKMNHDSKDIFGAKKLITPQKNHQSHDENDDGKNMAMLFFSKLMVSEKKNFGTDFGAIQFRAQIYQSNACRITWTVHKRSPQKRHRPQAEKAE